MDLISLFRKFLNQFNSKVRSWLSGKYWAEKVTVIVLIVSLFMAFPGFNASYEAPLTRRALAVQAQIASLDEFWKTSPPTNSMFRITVPLIASALHLNLQGTLVLQFLTGIIIFYVVARLIEMETSDRLMAFYVTLLVGVVYPGTAAFLENRFYFDSFAYLFLLCAMWFRSPVLIALTSLLAFFTDERALIASGFVFLWWVLKAEEGNTELKQWFNLRSVSVVIAMGFYVMIRWLLMSHYQIQTWSESHSEFLLFDQINNSISGMWSGLEAGWILVGLSMVALAIRRRWFILISFLGVVVVQVVAALSVVDITRSMGYLLPAMLLAILILRQSEEKNLLPVVELSALVSLAALNYGVGGKSSAWMFYPFPVQIIRLIFGSG